MPTPKNSFNANSSSGNDLADLSDSIIRAIESGFQGAAAQAQTGGATPDMTVAGGSAATPTSSLIEPPGGIGGAGHGPSPSALADSPIIEPSGGIAPPPPGPHNPATYAAAKAQRDEIESHLQNEYTDRGDFSKIGGNAYKDDLQEELQKSGLAKEKRGFFASREEIKEKFTSGLFEEGVGVGYPTLELAEGLSKRIEKLNSGQYVSPEEQQHSLAEAALPGAGGIIGAVAGTLVPGIGPVLGSFAGQAIGEVASATIGAKSERDETTREAAEKLASALSLAEASVHSFREQITATGAPVKQVSEGLSILESTGAIGSGAGVIAGQGRLALGLGEQFGPVDTAIAQTLASDPALYQASSAFRTNGELSSQGFRGIAKYELLEGNPGAYTAFQQASAAERYESDPAAKKAIDNQKAVEGSWWDEALHARKVAMDTLSEHLGPLAAVIGPIFIAPFSDPVEDARKQTDAAKEEADEKAKKQTGSDFKDLLDRGAANLSLLDAGSSVNRQIGEYRYSALGPETPQQLARRLPGIKAALDQEAAADQTKIEQDQRELAKLPAGDPANESARAGYQLEISRLQDDKIEKPNVFYREFVKQNYVSQIEETGAVSSLAQTRSTIEGRSASVIQREVDQQASYLTGMATAPGNPLSPQEAAGIQESALKMRYAAKIETYSQDLRTDDARVERAGLGVTEARLNGTPGEVYSAQTTEVDALSGKIRELTEQLHAGGLSADDFTAKMRQRTEAEGQSAQLMAERRDDRLAAGDSLASSRSIIDTAGLPQSIRSGGAGVADYDMLNRDYAGVFAADQATIDAFKPGDPRRQAAEAKLATDRAGSREFEDKVEESSPFSARTRTENIRASGALDSARHAFDRDMKNPYMDGDPENSPFTAGRKVEGLIDADVSLSTRNAAAETAYRTSLQGKKGADGKPLWDDLAEEKYAGDMVRFQQGRDSLLDERADIEEKRRKGIIEMLPEMIGGSPGQGNLSGVLPTPGQAAYYNGDAFITGTFGKPGLGDTASGEHHTAQVGGAAGAFLSATAGGHAAMHGDSGPAILAELQKLNANLMRGSIGGRSPAMTGNPAGFTQNLNQTIPGNGYSAPGR